MRAFPRAMAVGWTLAVTVGFVALGVHAARPGDPGSARSTWPGGSRLTRLAGTPTLVLFLDPSCPCSSASLTGLGRVLARLDRPVTAWVVASGDGPPPSLPPGAGVRLVSDPGAREAARFGVATSGQVFLYDPKGLLLFSGGITPARGHEGDCLGLDLLFERVAGRSASIASAPVFGCPLTNPLDPMDERGR